MAHAPPLRIGTRASALALAQARHVGEQLTAAGGLGASGVEIVPLTTTGDRGGAGADRVGAGADRGGGAGRGRSGDKSRWVDTIEQALLENEIDLAVHSAKDVPGELAPGLELLGAPARAAVEDVLCLGPAVPARGAQSDTGAREPAAGLETLGEGARVGSSSLRRAAQLRAARGDLEVVAMRGNVDTRLRRLAEGDYDAIVLARAGLVRLGREEAIGAVLDPARFIPAPGQGALALEARAGDARVRETVAAILDADASACLAAERALARALDADCHTPLGAHATPAGCGCLLLRAWVGLPDGSAWLADELVGGFYDPSELGARVAERMRAAGAGELLAGARAAVGVAGG